MGIYAPDQTMLENKSGYTPTDLMRDLIDDNNLSLMVIGRFGISLGFGDATIQDVCRHNDVDCHTFLAVANFIAGKKHDMYKVSLQPLMCYLKHTHSYFLDFILPIIRRKFIEAINCSDTNDVAFLILKFYDDYMAEVRRHMEYENDTIFSYVEKLLSGTVDPDFTIAHYSASHEDMVSKLNELKEIVIRHYHQRDNDLLISALYDIINCEHDLMSHCAIEDRLFVPAVRNLEKQVLSAHSQSECGNIPDTPDQEAILDSLSNREKEIIRCVARGLSNKEIADELYLSIHTITTYRRNISSKLDIHSSAGLAIFAIIHGIITLEEVNN